MSNLRKLFIERAPKAQRTVAYRQFERVLQPLLFKRPKQCDPALFALSKPGLHGDQLLFTTVSHANDDQNTLLFVLHSGSEVEAVSPPVHVPFFG